MSVTRRRPTTPRIDKHLFESGSQCAKRLYLDAREPLPPADSKGAFREVGERVLELALQAFPGGTKIEAGPDAARQTRELLEGGKTPVLTGARFEAEQSEVEADVVIAMPDGALDIFEVKAGTTVKPRHLMDVALQVFTIEQCGFTVKSASVLHLDPKYRHRGGDGGSSYSVQRLFKRVDVTARVRKLQDRVRERLARIERQIDDESSLDLPMGTWCTHPLPCPRMATCAQLAPEHPLIELPELTFDQEQKLHEQGIESMLDVDPAAEGLTLAQRRALRALRSDSVMVEPFVREELQAVDEPIAFLHVQWHVEMLPTHANQRPWQPLPIAWAMIHLTHDGEEEVEAFAVTKATDPRGPCLAALAEVIGDAGTVVVYQQDFHKRLHRLLDADHHLKTHVRQILAAPTVNLAHLVRRGVYATGFRGRYDLESVATALSDSTFLTGHELRDPADVAAAYERLQYTRTHVKTREKIGASLQSRCENAADAIRRVFDALRVSAP